jgi:hypothetical protein
VFEELGRVSSVPAIDAALAVWAGDTDIFLDATDEEPAVGDGSSIGLASAWSEHTPLVVVALANEGSVPSPWEPPALATLPLRVTHGTVSVANVDGEAESVEVPSGSYLVRVYRAGADQLLRHSDDDADDLAAIVGLEQWLLLLTPA